MAKKSLDQQIIDAIERRKMFLTLAEREQITYENLMKRKFNRLEDGRKRTTYNEVDKEGK